MCELRVFVASSSEQLEAATRVANALRDCDDTLSVHVWEDDVFDFSAAYIESLEKELDRADFLVAVLTADDSARVREQDVRLPRDNVTFELGLFVGRLGRPRCFFFVEGGISTQIASDLSGVKPVMFYDAVESVEYHRRTLEEQVAKVALQMRREGARYKPTPAIRIKQDELWQFSSRFAGHWWERMRRGHDDSSALSYVTVTVDPATNAPHLRGKTYGKKGGKMATWSSIIAGASYTTTWQVFYRWEGEHDATTGQTYGGGGQIIFDDDKLESALGFYYDTNYAKLPEGGTTRIKRFGLFRCKPDEVAIMKTPWTDAAKQLTSNRLKDLSDR